MGSSYDFKITTGHSKNLNINTSDYWDNIWKNEWRETWRIYPETTKRIIEAIGSNKEVLEIGCGVGTLLKQIRDNKNEVTGVDISPFAVSLLKEEGIRAIQSVLPNIPLKDNSFDVVVGAEILEHVDDDKELMMQCNRVCRKGGKIILIVPDNCLGSDEEPEHIHKYDFEEFKKLLSSISEKVSIQRCREQFATLFKGRTVRISLPLLIGIVTKE